MEFAVHALRAASPETTVLLPSWMRSLKLEEEQERKTVGNIYVRRGVSKGVEDGRRPHALLAGQPLIGHKVVLGGA
jgi:hypothetical protein